MEKTINKILEDIYMVDETLRPHEEELKKVVEKLISSKPEAEIDEDFLVELRSEILKRAGEIKTGEKEPTGAEKESVFGKLAYALGGAALVLILVIPFLDRGDILKEIQTADNSAMDSMTKLKIAKLNHNAFGVLGEGTNGDMAVEEFDAGTGIGGGEGMLAPKMADGDMVAEQRSVESLGESAKMIAPSYIDYKFVYAGDEISSPESELEVYRKVKSGFTQNELAQRVVQMNFGSFDMSKFRNTSITNLNIVEDHEFGYTLYINLAEGNLTIGSNWEKWPRPDEDCRDQACFDRNRLKISDVPSDNELIDVADKFLNEYEVDMKNYGKGEVLDYWRHSYDDVADKSTAWIPEIIQVVYPLIIEGEEVYDEGGNKSGLLVEVNIRYNKVSGLNNIMTHVYESSAYAAETDTSVIKKIAENGGRNNRYYFGSPENSRTVTLELGTPKIGLVQYWNYDKTEGDSTLLYVPSYIFPIINKPDYANYYQESIVVPLVKDLLKDYKETPGRPMPLIEPRTMIEEPMIKTEIMEIEPSNE